MNHELIVQPTAKADITRNAIWWADNHSLQQAIDWVDAVETQLNELKRNPERFGFALENGLFSYPLRQMPIGLGNRQSYRAGFTIRGSEVHVLTIRRAAQDAIIASDLPPNL